MVRLLLSHQFNVEAMVYCIFMLAIYMKKGLLLKENRDKMNLILNIFTLRRVNRERQRERGNGFD